MNYNQYYSDCRLCPRNCGIDRTKHPGRCGCMAAVKAARAGLHYYEEPFLSGSRGSGTVFFSGCSLGCVYCQNGQISRDFYGMEISIKRLAEIFLEQQGRGAHNINLVTGTHFTPSIAEALKIAKDHGLSIPVVWNSSGYEKAEVLRLLDGLVDIFLPDFKTMSPELGKRYMKAPDYPEWAKEALACMVEISGPAVFRPASDAKYSSAEASSSESAHCSEGYSSPEMVPYSEGESLPETVSCSDRFFSPETISFSGKVSSSETVSPSGKISSSETLLYAQEISCSEDVSGSEADILYEGEGVLMERGVVVRHLVIPTCTEDSKRVLEYLFRTYGHRIWISLMSQYTPVGLFASDHPDPTYPELSRTLTQEAYDEVVDYAIQLGIENCMIQEGETASDSFIPLFDGSGIL